MRSYNRALFISIVGLIIYTVGFVTFIFYSISNFAFSDFYKRLNLRCDIAAQHFLEGNYRTSLNWTKEFVDTLHNQREFYAEIGSAGEMLLNHGFDKKHWNKISKDSKTEFQEGDIFYFTNIYGKGDQRFVVGVSAENYFYTHHLAYLRNLLLVSLVFGVLLVIVISLLVKRSFIRPISLIIRDVQNIGSTNLHRRLPVSGRNDVLTKLARTFNEMLNRIETSFETQKNFISNASHELNTPLTTIIGAVDLSLTKERSGDEYRMSLKKILESAEHLEKKTKALLLLARTGYENKKLDFKPVRIDQVIMDSELMVRQINQRYLIKFDFSLLPDDSMKLKVKGNASLLQLAVSNIITNACKYSKDFTAHVALGVADHSILVIIQDNGIGIPENELQHIYDPYFRASNTSNYSGYGIGLPLARNIILMHGGVLTVNSVINVGTEVIIEIPTLKSL